MAKNGGGEGCRGTQRRLFRGGTCLGLHTVQRAEVLRRSGSFHLRDKDNQSTQPVTVAYVGDEDLWAEHQSD